MKLLTKILGLLLLLSMLNFTVGLADEDNYDLVAQSLPIDFSPGMMPDPNGYIGEWEYSDPTIHVTIKSDRAYDTDYWVADIQIGHASQLRTAAAESFSSNMSMPGEAIARRMNAVLAINGDYFNYTAQGYTLRQGTLFKNVMKVKRDVLLIDEAGDFHFVRAATPDTVYTEVDEKKVINAFWFGPVLVEDGVMVNSYGRDEMAIKDQCQRMCIGQVGPLHYQVVCCASEHGSKGLTIKQFAQLVYDLGIPNAFNLDGGNSTIMVFHGAKVNYVDNPKMRDLADIIYFASSNINE